MNRILPIFIMYFLVLLPIFSQKEAKGPFLKNISSFQCIEISKNGEMFVSNNFWTVKTGTDTTDVFQINADSSKVLLFSVRKQIKGMAIGGDSVLYFSQTENSGCHVIKKYHLIKKNITLIYACDNWHYFGDLIVQQKTGNIYVMEYGGDNGRTSTLSMINPFTGVRTAIAGKDKESQGGTDAHVDGIGNVARFRFTPPQSNRGKGMVFSKNQDTLYLADFDNFCIRKVILNSQSVSTFAGSPNGKRIAGFTDGQDTLARFANINGIEIDSLGYFYVADQGNKSESKNYGNRIRKISPSGKVYSICGNGVGFYGGGNRSFVAGIDTFATIGQPNAIRFNKTQDTLWVSLTQELVYLVKSDQKLKVSILDTNDLTPDFSIPYTIASTNKVNFSIVSGPATIIGTNNDQIHITGIGEVIVKATAPGDLDLYKSAEVYDTFLISKPVTNFSIINKKINLTFFPNPVSNQLIINSSQNTSITAKILTLTGEVILTSNVESTSLTMDVSNLVSSLYLLIVECEGEIFTRLISKK